MGLPYFIMPSSASMLSEEVTMMMIDDINDDDDGDCEDYDYDVDVDVDDDDDVDDGHG